MNKKNMLEKFGQILIAEVRDEAIEKFESVKAGKIRSVPGIELHNKLSKFDEEQLSVIRETVISSIDDVVHNFLWMLEQREDDMALLCRDNEGSSKQNIGELSDGLSGEIYTEDGWIAKYSNYKENF